MRKGRGEEAREALRIVFVEEKVEGRMEEIEKEINMKADIHWTPSAIVRTFHMVVVVFLEPSLGGNTLAFYAGDIWENICGEASSTFCITFFLTVYNLANMLFTLLAGIVFDYSGRKNPTVFSTLMTGVSLFLIGFSFSSQSNLYLALLIYFFLFWFCLGVGTSWQILMVEIAPKFGVKICVLSLTLSNFLLSVLYDYAERLIGQSKVFYIYSGLAFFLAFYILVFVKESISTFFKSLIFKFSLGSIESS
jgi:MFS family permease